MESRIRRMEGVANFHTFAFLRQAAWNTFDTAKAVSEGANYHRTSAVLFSALTIEAHLNHVGKFSIPNWGTIEPRLRWRDKFDQVVRHLKITTDKSSRSVETIIELFTFRDKFVHGKTRSKELRYKHVDGHPTREVISDPAWLRRYWRMTLSNMFSMTLTR